MGKGVTQAVGNVNGEIAAAVAGFDALDQKGLDRALIDLDGTPNKSRLGANAILGVSLAAARAAAAEERQPLWRYLGGEAARDPAGADDERAQRRRPRRQLGRLPGVHDRPGRRAELLRGAAHGRRGLPPPQGERCTTRAWAAASATRAASRPTSSPTRRRCEALMKGIEAAGYTPGEDVAIALDPATSEIYDDGRYELEHEGRELTPDEMAGYWADVCSRYPILSIEDGMDEEDWDGWKGLTAARRRPRPARRRRPLRDQHRAPGARDRARASPTRSSSRSTRSAR